VSGSGKRGKIVISDEALQQFIDENTAHPPAATERDGEWP
jgi:hypothetical protein